MFISCLPSILVPWSSPSPHPHVPLRLSRGHSAFVLHGELYSILVAALLAPFASPPMYSDNLTAVGIINDALHSSPLPHSLHSLPPRSLSPWIISVLRSSIASPSWARYSRVSCGNVLRPPGPRRKLYDISVLAIACLESSIHITNILFLLTLPEQNVHTPGPPKFHRELGWDSCPVLKHDVVRY